MLLPLDADATRSTSPGIVDDVPDLKFMDKFLALADFFLLPISLIANLVPYEGCEFALQQWHSETTSLLSDGFDKLSNVERPIMVSISSGL